MDAEVNLDQTPLKFGNIKGKTPDKVSELDPQYLSGHMRMWLSFLCTVLRCIGALEGRQGTVHDKLDASSRNAESCAGEKASPALSFDTDDDVPF